jgi:hypothetical protein
MTGSGRTGQGPMSTRTGPGRHHGPAVGVELVLEPGAVGTPVPSLAHRLLDLSA